VRWTENVARRIKEWIDHCILVRKPQRNKSLGRIGENWNIIIENLKSYIITPVHAA
jgi:hypothetical protein